MIGKNGKAKKKKSMAKALRNMVVRVALIVLVISTAVCWLFMKTELALLMEINGQSIVLGMKAVLGREEHFEEYALSVMETYHSIPEEIRKDPKSDEYRAYFKEYRTDEYIKSVSKHLSAINNILSMQNMYLAAVDLQHDALVMLLDVDEEYHLYPLYETGEWIPLTEEMKDAFSKDGDRIISANMGTESEEETSAEESEPDFIIFESKDDEVGTLQTIGLKTWNLGEDYRGYILCTMPGILGGMTVLIFIVIYFITLFIAILLIVIVTRIRLRKKVIRPINAISHSVEDYAKQRTEGSTQTACFSDLSINTGDELEELARTMTQMEQDLNVYEKNLKTAIAREERVNTELSVATGIQSHMLPDAGTAFSGRKDFTIAASMTPAREVGGDFYDFFLIDEDHLGLVMADVSGKGIPAALFMMFSMIVINNFASMGFSPSEVLEHSNNKICRSNVLDMFVTAWFGILDLKTGEITAANAGHEYPAVCGAEGRFELLHDKHGLVIGAMEGVKYKEYTFCLEKGGMLFLYTDGVPEATDVKEELYGTDRMLRALNSAGDHTPAGLDRELRADISRFIAEAPQFDDLTTLFIQYHPDHQ